MSCINRNVGNTPVELGFAKIAGRPKWAIPWLEDDPGLTIPQLWAGRMRRDAADARKYGCTGLMGIHWRTRILGPNVSALAHAAWDQTGWQGRAGTDSAGTLRYAPVDDFYADWARAEFGAGSSRTDCRPLCPTRRPPAAPGQLGHWPGEHQTRSRRPWEQVAEGDMRFVDDLAALRPQVVGPGNLERFDYWLNTFGYLRSVAEVRCVWARFNAAMDKARAEKDPDTRKNACAGIGPSRPERTGQSVGRIAQVPVGDGEQPRRDGQRVQLAAADAAGVVDHPRPGIGRVVGRRPAAPMPIPSKEYAGPPRLFVPEVRTGITAGEIAEADGHHPGCETASSGIILAKAGERRIRPAPLQHVARGVYAVTLPAEAVKDDFEYYVSAVVGETGGPISARRRRAAADGGGVRGMMSHVSPLPLGRGAGG